MKLKPGWLIRLISAEFFSPKDFVRHAVLILVLFAMVHVCGLREYTSIISGTMASPTLGPEVCAILGMGYMALYFGAVGLAPILLIAAGLLAAWERVGGSPRRPLP